MNSELPYTKIKKALDNGQLIVYPTDTLYALGASIFNEEAVKQVFSIKHRPSSLPLPIAVSSVEMMKTYTIVTTLAERLIEEFLPGPLTLILENKSIPKGISANKTTIAVRIPNDSIALDLLEKTGPLTATSANIHSQSPLSTIKEIKQIFTTSSIVPIFIDGGIRKGLPSTIVDATTNKPLILREGVISSKDIHGKVFL
jgi:L-threonylcarbamoyladenylate synthase